MNIDNYELFIVFCKPCVPGQVEFEQRAADRGIPCALKQRNAGGRLQRKKHNEQAGRLRYDRVLIAVNMPCMIANGAGGQPGTATSTGITFDTRPQLA